MQPNSTMMNCAVRALFITFCLFATGCSSVNPMELLPSVDRLVLNASREKAPKASAISVQEMLANVRAKGEKGEQDDGVENASQTAIVPDLVVSLDKDFVSPGIYQSVAGFLAATADHKDTPLVVTRSTGQGLAGINSLSRAEKLGRILSLGGRKVRLAVSDAEEEGTYRISLDQEVSL